jgi:hypothetical protein
VGADLVALVSLWEAPTDEITTLKNTEAEVPQGSFLGPVLNHIYTNYLPTSEITTATFADDTAILTIHENSTNSSMKLQAVINKIEDLANKWKIKVNQSKSKPVQQCKLAKIF